MDAVKGRTGPGVLPRLMKRAGSGARVGEARPRGPSGRLKVAQIGPVRGPKRAPRAGPGAGRVGARNRGRKGRVHSAPTHAPPPREDWYGGSEGDFAWMSRDPDQSAHLHLVSLSRPPSPNPLRPHGRGFKCAACWHGAAGPA
eukprot:scaffold2081_cov382-Prasinococcus_capsulatus_cf.AAC.2